MGDGGRVIDVRLEHGLSRRVRRHDLVEGPHVAWQDGRSGQATLLGWERGLGLDDRELLLLAGRRSHQGKHRNRTGQSNALAGLKVELEHGRPNSKTGTKSGCVNSDL